MYLYCSIQLHYRIQFWRRMCARNPNSKISRRTNYASASLATMSLSTYPQPTANKPLGILVHISTSHIIIQQFLQPSFGHRARFFSRFICTSTILSRCQLKKIQQELLQSLINRLYQCKTICLE